MATMTGFDDDEARSFAHSFRSFLAWVHADRFDDEARN